MMNHLKRKWLFFFAVQCITCSVLSQDLFGQKFHFRNYTVSEGLAQNTVLSLLQDRSGRMWIGTVDGLSCYDGSSFRNFGREDGLADGRIYSIHQQFENVFWIGSHSGVSRLEFGAESVRCTIFGQNEGFKLGTVECIVADDQNNLYFGGSSGVARYTEKEKRLEPVPNFPAVHVRCGIKDHQGNLWFGTDGEIIRLSAPISADTITRYGTQDGLVGNKVRGLFEDDFGNLWAAVMEGGVARFLGDQVKVKFQTYTVADGLPSNICYSVTKDKLGAYWVGTFEGAAKFSFQPPENRESPAPIRVLQVYQEPNGLAQNIVIPICVDRENNLWFGTHRGLSKLSSEKFVNYDVQDGLASESVHTLIQDRDGDIWLGTPKGLNVISNGKILNLNPLFPKLNKDIVGVVEDADGHLWVAGTDNLVVEFQKRGTIHAAGLPKVVKTIENYWTKNVAINLSLAADHLGNIWIGTYEGLFCYDGQVIRRYEVKDGLSGNRIHDLNVTDDGSLWAGTDNGATRIELVAPSNSKETKFSPKFSTLQVKDGLIAASIGFITKDSSSNMWFSTEGNGLIKWDGRNFSGFTTANGLSNNVVNYLLEHPAGTFWVETNKGVDKLQNGTIHNYNANEGFSRKGTDAKKALVDREGNIWFATQLGVTKYSPGLDYVSQAPPVVEIKLVQVNQQPLTGDLWQQLLSGATLEFAHGEKNLEIEFIGISFAEEEGVTYQCQLEGADGTWSAPTKFRTARYPNLSPGSYTFHVKAFTQQGIPSRQKSISFRILKPIWFRTWFLGLMMTIFLGMVYALYRYRVKAIKDRNRLLELRVIERTSLVEAQKNQLMEANLKLKELDQIKADFTAMLVHDLKSPLSVVKATLELFEDEESIKQSGMGSLLSASERSVEKILSLINEVLEVFRSESQKMDLKRVTMDPGDLLRECAEESRVAAQAHRISVNTAIADDLPQLLADREKLGRAFANLLSNANKFTPPGGIITIEAHTKSGTGVEEGLMLLVVTITDTGEGISAEELPYLFEAYRQGQSKQKKLGVGLGLSIVKRIIAAHGGNISARSQLGVGTSFTIVLPILTSSDKLQKFLEVEL